MEIKIIPLHHETKQVTALITLPKAAPGLRIGENDESWRVSVAVKWTEPDVVFTGTLEFHSLTDNVNQVDSLFDVFYYCHGFCVTNLLENKPQIVNRVPGGLNQFYLS